MAYRLDPGAGVAAEVVRIASEEVGAAEQRLRASQRPDRDVAVHEARKAFKRVRALLRLVRAGLPAAQYRREQQCFRDTGRRLSAARDTRVLLQTLALVRQDELVSATAFDRLGTMLQTEHGSLMARAQGEIDAVVELLVAADQRIRGWEVDGSHEVVLAGVERAYRRGRKRLRKAVAEPTDERLHEWRKRAKDLWYHLDLLSDAWPGLLGPTADLAHELTDLLGKDHDLAVLKAVTSTRPGAFADPADRALLADLVDGRRAQLHAAIWPLGRRLYTEKPGAYAARVGGYLRLAAGP